MAALADYCKCLLLYRHKGIYHYVAQNWHRNGHDMSRYVDNIPRTNSSEFKQWLEGIRALVDTFHGTIPATASMVDGKCDWPDTPLESYANRYPPSFWPKWITPSHDWVLTLDLDLLLCSINNTHWFALYNLPKKLPCYSVNLLDAARQGDNAAEIDPIYQSTIDDGELSSLCESRPRIEPELVRAYDALEAEIVIPKKLDSFLPGKRSAVWLAKNLHRRWIGELERLDVSSMTRFWTNAGRTFRELVLVSLYLAAGSPEYLSFGGKRETTRRYKEPPEHDQLSFVDGTTATIFYLPRDCADGPVELVTEVLSPYHADDASHWHAPIDELFWLQDVLVYPVLHLDDGDILNASIARLVQEGRLTGHEAFHGIIVSLESCVLVRCLVRGFVEHTRIMRFDSHSAPTEDPDAFTAMAHIFEAAQLEKLSKNAAPGPFPTEIYQQVLRESCFDTWKSIMQTSRLFRQLCQSEDWRLTEQSTMLNKHYETNQLQINDKEGTHLWRYFPSPELERRTHGDIPPTRIPRDEEVFVPILGAVPGGKLAVPRISFAVQNEITKLYYNDDGTHR